MNYLQMPQMKTDKALSEILSRDEITSLFEHCGNLKHKARFALAYVSGLRVSEICALLVQDIDFKSPCSKSATINETIAMGSN